MRNRSVASWPRAFFVSPGSLGKSKKLALGRARTVFDLPYPGGLDEKRTSAANRACGAILARNVARSTAHSEPSNGMIVDARLT